MQTVSRIQFTTVKTEGAILPADLLQRVADGRDLDGLKPADYHLAPNERLNEAVSRAWNRCLGVWQSFDDQRQRLPDSDAGTTLTRERWLLILFQELGYGRLSYQGSLSISEDGDGPNYPISHAWGQAPIHLITFRQDLDRRDPSSKRSPHSLVQEFLNRSDSHLWGFVSNGLRLRVLRDNASLTRAAYVEFDLEAMMEGELYADFGLLWLICHQSRVEVPPEGGIASCWLERWHQDAAAQGTRALDALRDGVQEAIAALGRGFLSHRGNAELRAQLRSGDLSTQDYYRQLLRVVYRLIFLFVAEDRDLLLLPTTSPEAQRRYAQFYSVQRLRDMAENLRGGPHPDLYRGLRHVFTLLREGYEPLGLPGLGGYLFSDRSTPALDGADIANHDLLEAVRALAFSIENRVRRPVDYKNLGAEELGSVYESLLELHPQLNADAGTFALDVAAGSERKTTGSYYTPSSLIRSLLDSALEPVVEDRLRQATADGRRPTGDTGQRSAVGRQSPVGSHRWAVSPQEQAILDIKVVDPACGSGHFLIAAAHRLARHLARARTGDEEPAPAKLRDALRDVVRHCIHGVDINPMAVELCKVALWMETLDPGRPLSFLERNIQCGNSLIGATPALLEKGIPDEAFTPITGDDRAYCSEWRRRNKEQRESRQLSLFAPDLQPWDRLGNLAAAMVGLDAVGDDTLEGVRRQQELYEKLVRSSDYRYGRLWADAWCAAYVWKKTREFAYPITEEVFRRIERNPFDIPTWMVEEIERLREQYGFFHWHLAFPHVFSVPVTGKEAENDHAGWHGGFDVVLGNPPWERIKLQEKEWFGSRDEGIATAPNAAARRRLIAELADTNRTMHEAFQDDKRKAEGDSSFVRNSGSYPLCGRGDVNTYAVFAELARNLQSQSGAIGIVVPSGIATDHTTRFFFQDLVRTRTLASLYSFENEEFIFPSIHHATKFCLLTLSGSKWPKNAADFVFFARQVGHLRDEGRHFTLSAEELSVLNPNTRTCPIFRTQRDAMLAKHIYSRVPVLVNETMEENPWGVSFHRMFDMANDSGLFRTREQIEAKGCQLVGTRFVCGGEVYLPLYEGKMFWHFDHRFGTYEGQSEAQARQGKLPELDAQQHGDPFLFALPRYWVETKEVLEKRPRGQMARHFIGFRDVTSSVVQRTAIFAILPDVAVGHKAPLLLVDSALAGRKLALLANLNSLVFDYITRQKLGGTSLAYFTLKQLPVLLPNGYPHKLLDFINARVLELTYTAWDLHPFAAEFGYEGPPFRWDEDRRFLLRCELDAAYFHLYGIERDDVDYIMETFPIVKRKDEAAHGEYRTKRVILEIYDEMQQAMETGLPYQTWLDPPPADPRVAHPAR